jgi:hypothetical protein
MPVLLTAVLLLAGCTKTFLVSRDCNTFFFGSDHPALYRTLCASGDLEKVLADAGLSEDVRAGLYQAQCTDRSREKVENIYGSLTSEQQEALKSAFRKHGYEINTHPAPNFRYDSYDDYWSFCPPDY